MLTIHHLGRSQSERIIWRIGARPAYARAMAKGDPDLTPMLS
jgi:hypothetical protein